PQRPTGFWISSCGTSECRWIRSSSVLTKVSPLEDHLQRQLNLARGSRSHLAGVLVCNRLPHAAEVRIRRAARRCRTGCRREPRADAPIRIAEVRVVEHVEQITPELN